MTDTLANPMATDAGHKVVACNPLRWREELLDSGQLGETHGGFVFIPALVAVIQAAAPWVLGTASGIVAGYVVAELTSNNGGGSCCCKK